MAEVIEFCAVSSKLEIYIKFIRVIENFVGECFKINSIQVMDDWNYTNVLDIESVEVYKDLYDNKILTLTMENGNNHMGVDVEKIGKFYIVEPWLNACNEITNEDYKRLIGNVVNELKHDEVEFCAIGKEIVVKAELGISDMLKNAHNVDLWLIKSTLWTKEYEKMVKCKYLLI